MTGSSSGPGSPAGSEGSPPVNHLLDRAADLLRAATQRMEQDRSTMRELIEYHPDADHFVLMAHYLGRTRRDIFYLSGRSGGCVSGRVPDPEEKCHSLIRRHGSVRLLYHPVVVGEAGRELSLRRLVEQGALVRVSAAHECGAVIFDRRCALLWEDGQQGTERCLVIRSFAVINTLMELLDVTWNAACGLRSYLRFDRVLPDDPTTRVLNLMTAGYTDDAAASRLDVSVRTYRRYVADVMRRLHAQSRFQAGARAAMLGLVDPAVLAGPAD